MNSSNAFLPYVAMPGWSWASILDNLDESFSASESFYTRIDRLQFLFQKNVKKPVNESKILVVGCGTGNAVVEIAKRGFQTFGIEGELELLESIVPKSKKASVEARIFPGNTYFQKSPEANFDCIVALDKAFHRIISSSQAIEQLRLWKSRLAKNGMVMIEVAQPNLLLERQYSLGDLNGNSMLVTISSKFLKGDEVRTEETIFLEIGDVECGLKTERKKTFRWWNKADIEEMLAITGFNRITTDQTADYSFIIGGMKNGSI